MGNIWKDHLGIRVPNIAVAVLLIPRLRQVKSVVCHGEEIWRPRKFALVRSAKRHAGSGRERVGVCQCPAGSSSHDAQQVPGKDFVMGADAVALEIERHVVEAVTLSSSDDALASRGCESAR